MNVFYFFFFFVSNYWIFNWSLAPHVCFLSFFFFFLLSLVFFFGGGGGGFFFFFSTLLCRHTTQNGAKNESNGRPNSVVV